MHLSFLESMLHFSVLPNLSPYPRLGIQIMTAPHILMITKRFLTEKSGVPQDLTAFNSFFNAILIC